MRVGIMPIERVSRPFVLEFAAEQNTVSLQETHLGKILVLKQEFVNFEESTKQLEKTIGELERWLGNGDLHVNIWVQVDSHWMFLVDYTRMLEKKIRMLEGALYEPQFP